MAPSPHAQTHHAAASPSAIFVTYRPLLDHLVRQAATQVPDALSAGLGATGSEALRRAAADFDPAGRESFTGFASRRIQHAFHTYLAAAATEQREPDVRRSSAGTLSRLIDSLGEPMRSVVRGYYVEQRPVADIAADLSLTPERVLDVRSQALAELRSMRAETGHPADAHPHAAVARSASLAHRAAALASHHMAGHGAVAVEADALRLAT